ncbi:MAG TPA: c-type cytochrome domain-containing protein, partial [Verrucomicrobiae bacterium]|nr:c-type cytochrome domain-containing protein [Verrucomicrobiae bacterium]
MAARKRLSICSALTGSLVVLVYPALRAAEPERRPAPQAMVILKANCFGCHNEEKKKGGLVLTARKGLLKGSENGPVLDSKKAEQSKILQVLSPDADPHMPPKKQLTDKQIDTLRNWIEQGAEWDEKALASFGIDTPLEKLGKLPEGYEPVLALALSPDGQRLAVARGNAVVVHETGVTNAPSPAELREHRDAVQSLAWSHDGKLLASGSYREIVIWNADSWKLEQRLTNELVGRVTALAFSPDQSMLAVADGIATKSGIIRIWKTALGAGPSGWKLESSWQAHSDSIMALDISHDGKLIASAGIDKLVKMFDLTTHAEAGKFEGHMGHVLGVGFSADDSMLASAGADKILNIWDTKTKEQKISVPKHPAVLTGLAWAANGKSLVSASQDGQARIYTDFKAHSGKEQSEGAKMRALPGIEDVLHCAAISSDGKTIYGGAQDGSVYVWNSEGKLKAKLAPVEQPKLADARKQEVSRAPKSSVTTVGARGTAKASAKFQSSPGERPLSFINDVLPVLSKAGCNSGSCHAKAEGQNGFKLSVFAYDPKSDYRQIVKGDRGRRTFPAFPAESLIVKKPTLGMEHEGGQRFEVGSSAYQILSQWIKQGMPYARSNE